MKIIICFVFVFALFFVHSERLRKVSEKKRGFGPPSAENVLVMEGVHNFY